MDYSKLSDNKINAEVALHWLGKGNFGLMNGAVETFGGSFDPCNNAADAWPIVVENGISLRKLHNGKWRAINEWGDSHQHDHENPLRAYAVVFLMMQESE